MCSKIVVRQVYVHNVEHEFNLIRQSQTLYPFASLVTEFPGTAFDPECVPADLRSTLTPAWFYKVMKENVDALDLIQLGLTLSDANGNLPSFGTPSQYVWEFNFRNPDSVSLLERQGIDNTKDHGIESRYFAELFKRCLLLPFSGRVLWVTFNGPYDFGFLIKILTRSKLPEDVGDFLKLWRDYFGPSVFDVKDIVPLFGLHGGLDQVAGSLNLDRVVGKPYQAGSDSLLTMHIFLDLLRRCN